MSASTSQGYGQCLVLNRCAREASNPEQGSDKGKKNENIDMDMGKNINAKFKSILAFLLPEKIGKGTFPIGHFPDEDFYQENNHHLFITIMTKIIYLQDEKMHEEEMNRPLREKCSIVETHSEPPSKPRMTNF